MWIKYEQEPGEEVLRAWTVRYPEGLHAMLLTSSGRYVLRQESVSDGVTLHQVSHRQAAGWLRLAGLENPRRISPAEYP